MQFFSYLTSFEYLFQTGSDGGFEHSDRVLPRLSFRREDVSLEKLRVAVGQDALLAALQPHETHVGRPEDVAHPAPRGKPLFPHRKARREALRRLVAEHLVEQPLVDGLGAEHVADEISRRDAEDDGQQEHEVPCEFHRHDDARDGRFGDGDEVCRHTDDDEHIGAGGIHAHRLRGKAARQGS